MFTTLVRLYKLGEKSERLKADQLVKDNAYTFNLKEMVEILSNSASSIYEKMAAAMVIGYHPSSRSPELKILFQSLEYAKGEPTAYAYRVLCGIRKLLSTGVQFEDMYKFYGAVDFYRNVGGKDTKTAANVINELMSLAVTELNQKSAPLNFLSTNSIKEKDKNMFTPEQQAAWLILQKTFNFVVDELKQRWQLAREKGKPTEVSQSHHNQPNVSQYLQNELKSRLENLRDTTQLRMMTDNLETAIKMAERYNRRRNKYRQQLPLSVDTVPIELQIEETEAELNKSILEIKAIFEKLIQDEVIITGDTN